MEHFIDSLMQFIKDLPAIFVIGWHLLVSALPTVILLLTVGYLILQIAYLHWKWKQEKQINIKEK